MNCTFYFDGDQVKTRTLPCCTYEGCCECKGTNRRSVQRMVNATRTQMHLMQRALRFLELDPDSEEVSAMLFLRRGNAFLAKNDTAWARELFEPLLATARAARANKTPAVRWGRGWG